MHFSKNSKRQRSNSQNTQQPDQMRILYQHGYDYPGWIYFAQRDFQLFGFACVLSRRNLTNLNPCYFSKNKNPWSITQQHAIISDIPRRTNTIMVSSRTWSRTVISLLLPLASLLPNPSAGRHANTANPRFVCTLQSLNGAQAWPRAIAMVAGAPLKDACRSNQKPRLEFTLPRETFFF